MGSISVLAINDSGLKSGMSIGAHSTLQHVTTAFWSTDAAVTSSNKFLEV
jgi:hypothetical protein